MTTQNQKKLALAIVSASIVSISIAVFMPSLRVKAPVGPVIVDPVKANGPEVDTSVVDSDLPSMPIEDLVSKLKASVAGNVAAFNSRHGNTRYRFSATVGSVDGPEPQSGAYLVFFESPIIPCIFDASHKEDVLKLSQGDVINVSGIPIFPPSQTVPYLMFTDCRLI